jgi:hypothetical protein
MMKLFHVLLIVAATIGSTLLVTWFSSSEPSGNGDGPEVTQTSTIEYVSREELDTRLLKMESMYRQDEYKIGSMRRTITALSSQVEQLQLNAQADTHYSDRSAPAVDKPILTQTRRSVAERFEGDDPKWPDSASGGASLEGAIYANLALGSGQNSTECRGSMCKVYNSISYSDVDVNDEAFANNVSASLDGNVNVYFSNEAGQRVMYIEAVQ